MVKQLSTSSSRIWLDTADPGVSETDAEQGNFWLNTSSNVLFVCKDPTGGVQNWERYPIISGAITQHGISIGDASSSLKTLAVAATGTILTGVTGADPAFSATPAVTSISIGSSVLTITSGAGAPGSTQPKGSLYLRTDGSGINDRMYINTDGAATWTAVVTLA